MRSILLATAMSLLPIVAFAQSHCAITAPADPTFQLPPIVHVGGAPVPLTPHARDVNTFATPAPVPPTSSLETIPVLAHIVSSGATLSDLGLSHGMRTVFASSKDHQFMVFQVTADGQAAVAGLMTDLSLTQLQNLAGDQLSELPVRHGVRGYFLRNGPRFQVFYATPDGQRLIPGVMWDATGHDMTRQDIASIPGAVPTVTIGKSAAPADPGQSGVQLASSTSYGSIGNPHAPSLWMFIDPQCSFSIRAMQQLAPYVAAGRVHLNVIPLSILDREDNGLSTKAALNLLSLPSDQIVTAWQTGQTTGDPANDASAKLATNMAAASALSLTGTPTFLWKKADGSEGRVNGIPTDPNSLILSMEH